eukprot:scaffold13344_cov215-Alexandrium_tamarense.AAC.7
MPRVLFGPREDEGDANDASREGFADSDFVILRYHWHAKREDLETNKFQKTIVDVSRLPTNILNSQARNIHVPLNYYCRMNNPRYSTSLLRVNHYLDRFEAFTYRNDARIVRSSKPHYDKKANGASVAMEDIEPWLRNFVSSVGSEKAAILLAGAGDKC